MSERILVVDDEAVFRRNLVRFLSRAGHKVEAACDGQAALELLASERFDVVLTDLRMPRLGGLELLGRIATGFPETLVVVMTAHASLSSALEALRAGAQDYLLKPVVLQEVQRKLEMLLEHRELQLRVRGLRRQLARYTSDGIVGSSQAIRGVLDLVARAGPTQANVLIQGETGTGKELVARALHAASKASQEPFLAVNLAAQPPDLVDATLFGHGRGAFTGARLRREGVLRSAGRGTVFLDEVGELPQGVQAKLLRALENREVLPLGEDRPVPVHFRLVAATNRALAQAVEDGSFRSDLYYRLNVFGIEVPPLRERREDIPELVEHFLQKHAHAVAQAAPRVSPEALDCLVGYRWPGNIRELSNLIERAVLLSDGGVVGRGDLPPELAEAIPRPRGLKEATDRFRRGHVRQVLAQAGGDKEEAARQLGVHVATVYRYLDES